MRKQVAQQLYSDLMSGKFKQIFNQLHDPSTFPANPDEVVDPDEEELEEEDNRLLPCI